MTTNLSGHSGVTDYVTGLRIRNELEACLRLQLDENGNTLSSLVALGIDVIGLNKLMILVAFLPEINT